MITLEICYYLKCINMLMNFKTFNKHLKLVFLLVYNINSLNAFLF